jgi:hypothetical protein
MTDARVTTEARTYGNWRKPTSPGLGRLGLAGTVVLFGTIILCLLVKLLFGLVPAGVIAAFSAVVMAPLLVRGRDGRSGLQWITARVAWTVGKARGGHIYRAGPLAPPERHRCRLPGLAAAITAADAVDINGGAFAILHHAKAGHVSVVLTTSPNGAALVDAEQVDQWVAHWGGWLAALANEPALVGCSVTIETAPDTGIRLRREVEANMAADAPPLAAQVLAEVVERYPAGSAAVSCRIALTWSTTRQISSGRARDLSGIATELGQRLPALAAGLEATGAGPARALTTAEIAAAVRVAFDPEMGPVVDEVGAANAGIEWEECGPTGADEHVDHYRHDSGCSITWQMSEAPAGLVLSNVLERLLAPHKDIDRKRVTLCYRPHDPAAAVRAVENDHKTAIDAVRNRKVGRARDVVSVQAAAQTAREQATGAGVVRFGMLVTATVTDPDRLRLAAGTVETLGNSSRLTLRRASHCQASSFLAALPLGLVLPDHLRVPQIVRDAL